MIPIVTSAQMRSIDTETIAEKGIPGAVLMENAGRAVVTAVEAELRKIGTLESTGQMVCIFCGPGNNGGDGFVVARVLSERGISNRLFLCGETGNLRGEAKLHANAFSQCGGVIHRLSNSEDLLQLHTLSPTIIVDALFGTGLQRNISGQFAEVVHWINQYKAPVLAIDIPSGVCADNGRVLGQAVQADTTIAMACAKYAHMSAPGFTYCGDVQIAEIGIPQSLAVSVATAGLLEYEDIATVFAEPSSTEHKGTRGHVLVIAGSDGKRGAGRLSALAALRGGAGLATLGAKSCDSAAPDPLMTVAISDRSYLTKTLIGKKAVLIGPGMPTDSTGADWVRWALQDCEVPLVLDADALNHLCKLKEVINHQNTLLITPHPGEASRLLGCTIPDVQSDRIAAVRELAHRYQAVAILKGARTCICDGSSGQAQYVSINPTGGPELATAGTGDVLAGLLTAILARGVAPLLAARAAVYWHGLAGSTALCEIGGPGVLSSDVLRAIPKARAQLKPTLA